MGAGRQACFSKTFVVFDIFSYPESIVAPTMVGPEEKFSKQNFSDDWKTLS